MTLDSLLLHEYRCKCGKLLFKGALLSSAVEVKCLRCGKISLMRDSELTGDTNDRYSLLLDEQANVVNVSGSAERILGFNRDEFMNMKITDIDRTLLPGTCYRLLFPNQGRQSFYRVDTTHTGKGGESLSVTVMFRVYRIGEKDYVFASVEKRDKPGVRGEGLVQPGVFCDFCYENDPEGNLIYVDPKIEGFLGYKPEELLGQPLTVLFPEEERGTRLERYLVNSSKRERYRVDRSQMLHKDGTTRIFQIFLTPNFSDAGSFTGYQVLNWLQEE